MSLWRTIVALALALATAASLLAFSNAPRDDGALTGRIVDESGVPVAGLELLLVPRDSAPPGTLPAWLEERAPDSQGFFGIALAPQPDRPDTRRTSSGTNGEFAFDGLALDRSFLLYATPGTHVVLGPPNGAACVAGDHVAVVAHELVALTLRFTQIDGAPTERILVRVESHMPARGSDTRRGFGQELLVDAGDAVLHVLPGEHSVTARSWSGSNQLAGNGGFDWAAASSIDTSTSNTVELTFAPSRTVDVFVRNSPLPFDRTSQAYVEIVPPDPNVPGALGRRPNHARIEADGTATVVLENADGPHVARLFSTSGRLLAAQPVEIVAPRTAVRFDLAALPVAQVSIAVDVPGGFTLDGLRILHHGWAERSIEQKWTVASDGRLSIASGTVADELLASAHSTQPSRLEFVHPRLGVQTVTLERGVFDYRVAFEPRPLVRLKLVGEQAAELVTSAVVSLGRFEPVDESSPHVVARTSVVSVERDTATNTLTVTGMQPGRWRFLVQSAPVANGSAPKPARTLATIDRDLTTGVHDFEVVLPRRHTAAFWCLPERQWPRTLRLEGEGQSLELQTDTSGRLNVTGLLAGRYRVWVDDDWFAYGTFDFVVPCDEVLWVGRPHDALRVALTRQDSPLAAAGLTDGDLVIGFDGLTFRQQSGWRTADAARLQALLDDKHSHTDRHYPPFDAWSFTEHGSTKLLVQRGDEVIDVAVGPIAAHTPEQLDALGGTLTPVYRE